MHADPSAADTVTSTDRTPGAWGLDDAATVLAFVSDLTHRDALHTRLVPLRADPIDPPTPGAARVAPPGARNEPFDTDGTDLDALAARVAVRATLVHLARVAPTPLRATTLSMLAVWAWHCGDGALAAVASAVALEEEPGYALADLVAHLVRLDVPPPRAR
ncbi:DUF4192 family protein [Mobilicoccus pelagius]|uniref:DUF4192 family protein n=1 Tax=Mobilicoccus pelagius TaxID=746032 RepID=UPI00030722E9|nr:DUF4192 family protein [Mobilicoccus pelagius]